METHMVAILAITCLEINLPPVVTDNLSLTTIRSKEARKM